MKTKRILPFLLFGSLLLVGLSACGGDKEEPTENAVKSEDIKPYGKFDKEQTFSFGRSKADTDTLFKGETITDNVYTKYLKEHSNIVPTVSWEAADYNQKLTLAISTGDIPDLLSVPQDIYKQLLDNDLIMDMTTLYEKGASDNLKKMVESYDQDLTKIASVDGKMMAIPIGFPYYEESVVWIRKDWLDKAGLQVPKTVDELAEAAKVFVDKDISGTGKTVGMTFSNNLSGLENTPQDGGVFFNQYGSFPQSWMKKDGKVVYGSIQPETKEVLQKLSEWYKDGIIDKEFATKQKDEKKAMLESRMGIYFGPFWATDFMNSYKKEGQKPEWIAITPSKEDGEKFQTVRPRPVNLYLVVSKKCKNPEAVMRAINDTVDFNNAIGDAKDYRLEQAKAHDVSYIPYRWAVPLLQMNITDAKKNKIEMDAVQKAVETGKTDDLTELTQKPYEQLKDFLDGKNTNAEQYLWKMQGIPAITDESKVEFVDKAYYGVTDGMKKYNANLQKLENSTFVKIVMGQEPISSFDKFVKQWKQQGGDKIQEEVEKAVKNGEVQ